ncbi:hypothetical protein GOODEAATRI_009291, partial [Goodea atripinnis]
LCRGTDPQRVAELPAAAPRAEMAACVREAEPLCLRLCCERTWSFFLLLQIKIWTLSLSLLFCIWCRPLTATTIVSPRLFITMETEETALLWQQGNSHGNGPRSRFQLPAEKEMLKEQQAALRTPKLHAGSTESWLFRFLLSCLDRFHGKVSPGGPTSPDVHGDNDPPERSVRKDGSLTQERSLRVSSSDDSISLRHCREERDRHE